MELAFFILGIEVE